ncbi:hypothetical protein [Pseudovibrio exalbescens]|uniref:hypothetical protein n=1 Tax=Pseudovibrio exalbescens TaxID=197461 RepID=UPI000C9B8E8C|nr:hypothetical protein [Pseudovibrio exalbescens]
MLKQFPLTATATFAGVLAFSVVATPALSQDSRAIIDKMMDAHKAAGFTTATYEEFTQDGTTVVLGDVNFEVPISFSIAEEKIAFDVTVSAPEMVLVKPAETDISFTFEEISIPEFTAAVDYNLPVDEDIKAPYPVSATTRMVNYTGFNVSYPKTSQFENATGTGPFADLAKLIHFGIKGSADRETLVQLDTRTKMSNGSEQITSQSGIDMLDRRDGRIARYEAAEQTGRDTFAAQEGKAGSSFEYSVGRVSMRDLNVMPLLAFMGIAESSEEPVEVSSSYSAKDIKGKATTPGEETTFSIGLVSMGRLTYAPGNLAEILDSIKEVETAEDKNGKSAPDMFGEIIANLGTYHLTNFQLQDLAVDNDEVKMRLSSFDIEEVAPEGFSTAALSGLELGSGREDSSVVVDQFTITDVHYPNVLEGLAFAGENMDKPVQRMLEYMPEIGSITVNGITVLEDGDQMGSLEGMSLSLANYINSIPTQIALRTDTLKLNPEEMDANLRALLTGDEVTVNQNLDLQWDESTNTLSISDLRVEMSEGFNALVTLKFSGVTRNLIENPDNAEEALLSVMFDHALVRVEDAPLARKFLQKMAEEQQMDEEALADMMVGQMMTSIQPIAGTDFGKELKDKLTLFLLNPEKLEIEMAPQQPVPFTQLMAGAMMAPQTLPTVLGATIRN